jgi:hypothetical protein
VGDGELIGEEEVAEEALRLRVIAIGSGLKLVLGEEEVTGERIPGSGSDGGGGGWRWPVMVSRAEWSEGKCKEVKWEQGFPTRRRRRDKAAAATWVGGDWRRW